VLALGDIEQAKITVAGRDFILCLAATFKARREITRPYGVRRCRISPQTLLSVLGHVLISPTSYA
jgi:hypothetical protein